MLASWVFHRTSWHATSSDVSDFFANLSQQKFLQKFLDKTLFLARMFFAGVALNKTPFQGIGSNTDGFCSGGSCNLLQMFPGFFSPNIYHMNL